MADEVTVTLYNISNCAFAKEDGSDAFGSLGEVCDDFLLWLPNLASVGETVTFEPSEDDSFLRAFCIDGRRLPGTDAVLIATWNESDNADDAIQLLAVNSAIGHADVSNVEIERGSLPGYPAYFVLLPGRNQLLNIRFEHRLNGTRALRRYIQGFMERESTFCVWDPKNDAKLLGYAPVGKKVVRGNQPEFKYQLVRRQGDIAWIRAQASNIRKIVRRAVVYPQLEQHRSFFEGAQRLLGLQPNNRLRAGINFEYEYKSHLDLEKLNQIIDACDGFGDPDDSWSDVGFEMAKHSGKVHWLSGSFARQKDTLRIGRTEGGMVDTEDLAELLGEGHLQRLIASAER